MAVIINQEITEPKLSNETLDALVSIAQRVLKAYGREEAEVGITLTDEETIHQLNREWRGVDAPTDVLSLPSPEEPLVPMEQTETMILPGCWVMWSSVCPLPSARRRSMAIQVRGRSFI